MAETHTFKISSCWNGSSAGEGAVTCGSGKIPFGMPTSMGGAAGRSNPEELLMGAVVACYSLTLAVLAERRKLPVAGVEVYAEADVLQEAGGTLRFSSLRLRPHIQTSGPITDEQRSGITDCAHKAEKYCLISNAIRGNVEVTLLLDNSHIACGGQNG